MTTNIGFNDHVGPTTDHNEMLNIVAPHEHQASPVIDGGSISYGQSCVFAAPTGGHARTREHFVQQIEDEYGDQCDNAAGDPIGGFHGNAKQI